jgi:hypothetical protein
MKIVEILLVTLNNNHETDLVYENNATYVKISNKHDFYEGGKFRLLLAQTWIILPFNCLPMTTHNKSTMSYQMKVITTKSNTFAMRETLIYTEILLKVGLKHPNPKS